MPNWLLPEYIEDVLPNDAAHIESMRRRVMDLLHVHGYQFVIPPLLEYVESLLSGSGSDMNLRMFKVVDQLSGRMMGLRADMTPQVARIDAHLLNQSGVTRLCYASSVVHALPCEIARTRELFQVGAELYGHVGIESDIEIQRLLLACLYVSGVPAIHLDFGHVNIFRSLIQDADISPELERELYSALQAKDTAVLRELVRNGLNKHLNKVTGEALLLLPELYGDEAVLAQARRYLPNFAEISVALDQLDTVADTLRSEVFNLTFDLSDLRGYHYHTGIVFAAYTDGCPNAIALGGRYDEIGKVFGRARPATGFSFDLKQVAGLIHGNDHPKAVLAPWCPSDDALNEIIAKLRADGTVVVVVLPGENGQEGIRCDRKLIHRNGRWEITENFLIEKPGR